MTAEIRRTEHFHRVMLRDGTTARRTRVRWEVWIDDRFRSAWSTRRNAKRQIDNHARLAARGL